MTSFPSPSHVPDSEKKKSSTESETTYIVSEMGNSNQKLTQYSQKTSQSLSLSNCKNVEPNETEEISMCARQGANNLEDDLKSPALELGSQDQCTFSCIGEDSRTQGVTQFPSNIGEADGKDDGESSDSENDCQSLQTQTKGLRTLLGELDEHSHSKERPRVKTGELFATAGPSSMPNSSNPIVTFQSSQCFESNPTGSSSQNFDSMSLRHIPVHSFTPPHSVRSVRITKNSSRQDISSIDPHDWLITQPQPDSGGDSDSDSVRTIQAVSTLNSRSQLALPSPLLSTIRLSTPRQTSRNIYDEGINFTESLDCDDDKSSNSSESNVSAPLTYEEMRAVRVKRNDARLVTLGLAIPDPSTPQSNDVDSDYQSVVSLKKHFGMIMPTKFNGLPAAENRAGKGMHPLASIDAPENNLESKLEEIRRRYPGRDSQIFSLASLLQTAVDATTCHENSDEVFVPPPIFVQGAAGTAKTSIVREIVQTFTVFPSNQKSAKQNPTVGSAYINCATISPSSIDSLVESAFHQIVRSFEVPKQERKKNMNRKLRLRLNGLSVPANEIRSSESQHMASVEEHEYDEAMNEEMEERIEENRRQMSQDPTEVANTIRKPDTRKRARDGKKSDVDEINTWPALTVTTKVQNLPFGESSSRSHDAPVAFGRSLRSLIGDTVVSTDQKRNGCAILILDHAEKLMNLAPKRSIPRTQSNYLAQMLLLPKELRLNLLVICISKSSLLHLSRKRYTETYGYLETLKVSPSLNSAQV